MSNLKVCTSCQRSDAWSKCKTETRYIDYEQDARGKWSAVHKTISDLTHTTFECTSCLCAYSPDEYDNLETLT